MKSMGGGLALRKLSVNVLGLGVLGVITLGVSAIGFSAFGLNTAQAAEVNVYSARQQELIKPLLDKFTAETGVKVNLITGKPDELLTRIRQEGRNSPADVLLSTDVGRLYRAKELSLLQPIESAQLTSKIPAQYRDPANLWFGLTMRARPILYVPSKVQPQELSTLENLADAKWRGRICIRSSDNVYNQSMVAGLIASLGADATATWASDFAKNFAQPPKGGDRDQIKAAASGVCDIAIANTYYLAAMLEDPKDKAAAGAVKVFWPNQQDRGAHVNISGAAVLKHAPNKSQAQQLMEYMVSPQAQQWYAEVNHEYPVVAGVETSALLQSFGTFKADTASLDKLGALNQQALMLMDKAGWK